MKLVEFQIKFPPKSYKFFQFLFLIVFCLTSNQVNFLVFF